MTTLAEALRNAGAQPTIPTTAFVAELAKKMNFRFPAQIAELAKAIGPTMPDPRAKLSTSFAPTISTTPWISEIAKKMDYRFPAQIAELAKAIGPTMPDPRAKLSTSLSSAAYVAELAKATDQRHPANVARLAKTIGPTLPRGLPNLHRPATAEMVRTIAGMPAFKNLLAAMMQPMPSETASPLDGLTEPSPNSTP
jgi:hypothetical protein